MPNNAAVKLVLDSVENALNAQEVADEQPVFDPALLRPQSFEEYRGQGDVVEYLRLKVQSAQTTKRPMTHTLILGPGGTGKTTLAHIVANELAVNMITIAGMRVDNFSHLLPIFERLETNDVLFIDEMHALPRRVQENLYDVLEDFKIDGFEGRGSRKRPVKKPLKPFTLIGATTHEGKINGPLLRRFGYKARLAPYTVDELTVMMLSASDRIYGIPVPETVATQIANLSRSSAANAYNLLKNFHEIAAVLGEYGDTVLTQVLKMEKLDPFMGLDYSARKYLSILNRYRGKMVGLPTLAAILGEQKETIQDNIEGFLMSDVYLMGEYGPLCVIDRNGRAITDMGVKYMSMCRTLQAKGWFSNERF